MSDNQVYEALLTAYEEQYNGEQKTPEKTTFSLSKEQGLTMRYVNVLPATYAGRAGAKVIFVDEYTGRTVAKIISVSERGDIKVIDALDITVKRCSYMAALAAGYAHKRGSMLSLGIVGYGKIGKECESLFRRLFNITKLVVISSPRKAEESDTYEGKMRKVITHDTKQLAACDVVITATTTRPDDTRLQLLPGYNNQLFISFDSGYMLDSEYRELPCFSDDPEQLMSHWREEFPFDINPVEINTLQRGIRPGASIYLYGIGLADFVIAKHI
jgi:ornithine cyclodeaminase/alanine dehydrogenase-like protein (mu-crystallin family)